MARIQSTSSTGRLITQNVHVGVLDVYGPERRYGRYSTGGSSMKAVLGPDAGGGNRDTDLPVIRDMNIHSARPPGPWIAGHLLNGELGGDGTDRCNLTPLTEEANRNHATYEQYIKRIVDKCRSFDREDRSLALPYWFGVMYRVDVSPDSFSAAPSTGDMYSYAYSHITIQYGIVRIHKRARRVEFADANDIDNLLRPPHGNEGPLEIHNQSGGGSPLQWPRRQQYPFDPGIFDLAARWFF